MKRAQVSLVERWAPRLRRPAITIAAMHPGWAETVGVRTSLGTRRSGTAAERARLWTFSCERRRITSDELAALS